MKFTARIKLIHKLLGNTSGTAGFTLLETIIAMAIMVMALASILAVESGSINASARGRQMNIVAMLARNKMVETEYDIEGKTFDEYKKEDQGQYPVPYQDYGWKRTVKEIEFPNLNLSSSGSAALGGGGQSAPAQGSGDDGGDTGEMMTKLITKFLSKAIREVTVTVVWKKGDSEQSFSVSTYWVDLNHEFELSI